MNKAELEQALKEEKAKVLELESKIKELSVKPDCDEQLIPLEAKIKELTTENESLNIRLKDCKDSLDVASQKVEELANDKIASDLESLDDQQDLLIEKGISYTDEQIANSPTDFVVIDGMTGLVTLPDGSVIKSQFMAMDVSDTGARRLILVAKVDGKVSVAPDVTNMEIRTQTIDGKKVNTLQAI